MADQDPLDMLAVLRAQFDQAREAYGEIAVSVARYQADLVKAGLSESDALALTAGFQSMLLGFVFGAFGPATPAEEDDGET